MAVLSARRNLGAVAGQGLYELDKIWVAPVLSTGETGETVRFIGATGVEQFSSQNGKESVHELPAEFRDLESGL